MPQDIIPPQPTSVAVLKTQDPLASIFPINSETLAAVKQDMETNGFDPVFPIVAWEGKNIVVDGHTRFAAASELGLETVPVIYKSFENEDDAVLYSFHIQRNRRNMSDKDILNCLALLENLQDAPSLLEKTRKETNETRAKELGISPNKVDKARKVMDQADDTLRENVQSGKTSINQAFNEIQETRRQSGEIKGQVTNGLGSAAQYTKFLGRFLKELARIKEDGWEDVSQEKVLADIESIRAMVED